MKVNSWKFSYHRSPVGVHPSAIVTTPSPATTSTSSETPQTSTMFVMSKTRARRGSLHGTPKLKNHPDRIGAKEQALVNVDLLVPNTPTPTLAKWRNVLINDPAATQFAYLL